MTELIVTSFRSWTDCGCVERAPWFWGCDAGNASRSRGDVAIGINAGFSCFVAVFGGFSGDI